MSKRDAIIVCIQTIGTGVGGYILIALIVYLVTK